MKTYKKIIGIFILITALTMKKVVTSNIGGQKTSVPTFQGGQHRNTSFVTNALGELGSMQQPAGQQNFSIPQQQKSHPEGSMQKPIGLLNQNEGFGQSQPSIANNAQFQGGTSTLNQQSSHENNNQQINLSNNFIDENNLQKPWNKKYIIGSGALFIVGGLGY